MELNPDKLTTMELYKILTGTVLPRPIAWVSTMAFNGDLNLAPFSFFNVASVKPPVLGFSPLIDEVRHEKDTLLNIRENGAFVVNIVSHAQVSAMNQTSAAYRRGINEFKKVGLVPAPSVTVRPPGVETALVRYECTLRQMIPFGAEPLSGTLILGDICHIHVHPDIYCGDKINVEKLDAVGRLAGNDYATTRDRFALARPKVGTGD